MDTAKLVRDRHAGHLRVVVIRNYDYGLAPLLERLALISEPARLTEISIEEAVDVIETILWKDLAYRSELMPRAVARQYAEEYIRLFSNSASRIFTNGKWRNYHDGSGDGEWNPMTTATFDAGVIVVHSEYAACIWVEDED